MSEPRNIGAVLLAAGASSRMGFPKALLRHRDGRTFLRTACDSLRQARLTPLVVVLAHHRALLEAELRAQLASVRLVLNPEPERGQVRSFAIGLAAAAERPSAIVALIDQPQLPLAVLEELVAAIEREPQAVHVPVYRGVRGHPTALPTCLAKALLAARPNEGARDVIARLRIPVREHEVADSSVLLDLDTPAELAAWRIADERASRM